MTEYFVCFANEVGKWVVFAQRDGGSMIPVAQYYSRIRAEEECERIVSQGQRAYPPRDVRMV